TGLSGAQALPTGFSVLSRTALKVSVPGAAVSGPILVTHAGGATTSSTFHVTPRISWASPGNGVVGTAVTVNGSGFDSTTVVRFNGAAAKMPGSWTANKIVVPV